MLLRKLVIDSFDSYGDAAATLRYSESWLKSRLAPNTDCPITDNAIDAIKQRLAEAGVPGGDALR